MHGSLMRIRSAIAFVFSLVFVCALAAQSNQNNFPGTGAGCGSTCPTISGTPSANQIAEWVSANAVQGASIFTDNGTTLAYSGTGGISSPLYTANGTGGGGFQCVQGAAHSAPTNGFLFQCPTSIPTAYALQVPSAGPLSAGSVFSIDGSGNISITAQPTFGGTTGSTPTGGLTTYAGSTSGSQGVGCIPLTTCGKWGTASGPIEASKFDTAASCGAAGTAANPSVVSCAGASAGIVACSVTASTGTCQVNTTNVSATSTIIVTQRSDTVAGTATSSTCNTTKDTNSTAPQITAVTAGTSFTFQLGTIATNPECFNYLIIN